MDCRSGFYSPLWDPCHLLQAEFQQKRGWNPSPLLHIKLPLEVNGGGPAKWRRSRLSPKLITTERKCRLISKATLPRPQPPAIPGAVQCFHSHPITDIQCPPSSLGDSNEATTFFPFFFLKKYDLLYFFFKFIFDCAGSSLLRGLFSSCGEQELFSSCGV